MSFAFWEDRWEQVIVALMYSIDACKMLNTFSLSHYNKKEKKMTASVELILHISYF